MKKSITLFLFMVFSSVCFSQNTIDDAIFKPDGCICNKLTKAKLDSIKSANDGEKTALYANGQLKYKEVKRHWKTHITCYHETGLKCKEVCLNFKTNIQKTMLYDIAGKKYMVCKGSLKY
ncbi:MAG: hypothetical protein ACT4ON_11920 [Bacteroidota bacterium]